ncbi:16S rRNA (cytosine1402-N4)-methyltransferase [Anaerobranca californiensis DSM 14826]|jgi:16S rRNA (cytosine1402-N4)-methyltransferase|uniref:Ribosomal RNA small subunit methyltransferase H n=1 Tax=Anaerobranca californiensis DSM 14826 TaxID=1120989 RepID=A0A1M6KVQ5_9FIRM|nr:16S rRNA (cytosine(1402)-N(4))-methyltransferase RsmH [Anaerobranca californiensis]SHJ62986.1 16S rRNA (cytosine1402-N4)-methyltransferase [Anaerobranca californiensis DSM 14826]
MEFKHTTVLLKETIDGLEVKEKGIYVDCTLGGGGHTREIFSRVNGKCTVIGIDQDQIALDYNIEKFAHLGNRFIPVKGNFAEIDYYLQKLNIEGIDGCVFDLGVSSPQLDIPERGFSYNHNAPLDMRMSQDAKLTAKDIVNGWSEEQLFEIISKYGEEKWARRIAKFIVENRPILTTFQLVDVIKKAIPKGARGDGPHPAKRTFQAIRIAVNDELGVLERGLKKAIELLKPKGRISVITFHSLEDRIVKNIFKEATLDCLCPREYPICVCNHKRKLKLITKKPIIPSREELEQNPRARSAKLRIAEKV